MNLIHASGRFLSSILHILNLNPARFEQRITVENIYVRAFRQQLKGKFKPNLKFAKRIVHLNISKI